MTSVALYPAAGPRLWRFAQLTGVVLTAVLISGLVAWPKLSLHILWDMVIPILPATFLINPLIWRNVCPLATLNERLGAPGRNRLNHVTLTWAAWAIGAVLLFVLVPARRFLFNADGPALAVTIVAVGSLAIAMGGLFAKRAGFCNAICPVLPVEKLYGQAPVFQIGTARCAACTVCTPKGCIDLAGTKTVAQTLGPTRRAFGWLATPFGVFAAAFPGFVLGYFTTVDGSLSSAPDVYLHVALYAVTSYVLVSAVVVLARMRSAIALPLLGAAAVGIYYWLAAPALGKAYGAAVIGPPAIRVVAMLGILLWLVRALPHNRSVGDITR